MVLYFFASRAPVASRFMLVTMTTVGYGDVSPTTAAGKAICICAMVFGILFLSMPLAIVGNNFCVIWEDRARVIFLEKFKEQFASGVSRKSLADHFAKLDTDSSGSVSYQELKLALAAMHVQMPKSDMQELWRALDWDGSGEVGVEEVRARDGRREALLLLSARAIGPRAGATRRRASREPDGRPDSSSSSVAFVAVYVCACDRAYARVLRSSVVGAWSSPCAGAARPGESSASPHRACASPCVGCLFLGLGRACRRSSST